MLVKSTKAEIRSKLLTRANANFVGIDLSMTSTGVTFLTGCGMIDSYNIKSDLKTDGEHIRRLPKIRDAILASLEISQEVENAPTLIAIEGYAMGIRGGMSFTIGELGGLVKEAIRMRDIDLMIVPPSNLKKFIGATGTGKDMVRLELYKKYELELPTNDEVDACVLALMAMSKHLLSEGVEIPKYQQEALAKCQYIKLSA